MSILNLKGNEKTSTQKVVTALGTFLQESGSAVSSVETATSVASLESISQDSLAVIENNAGVISEAIRTAYSDAQTASDVLGLESLSQSQLEAGSLVGLAYADAAKFAQKAVSSKAVGTTDIKVVSPTLGGVAGRLDFREEASLEAFDNVEIEKMIPQSIAFNVEGIRQNEFSEAFYPTAVTSPENGGLDITLDYVSVFNSIKHSSTGTTLDFGQRNLLDAVSDSEVLADESTALVPFVQPDGSNADMFVDPDIVAPTVQVIAGVSVPTAPLVTGKEIGLIGISNHPGLIGANVLDSSDALDGRLFLKNTYISVPFDNAGAPALDVFRFNVARLPRSGFNQSIEGSGREMTLNFRSNAIVINGDTLTADGVVPASLAVIKTNNLTVRLAVNMSGNAHLEFGSVQVFGSSVDVISITDVDGNEISLEAGVGADIVAILSASKIEGYDLGAFRTNSNRRTRGLLLNNNSITERFAIPLGAPISIPAPVGSGNENSDLKALISASRLRNDNNAVTTLLNYADSLRSYVKSGNTGDIEGIARTVVTPFFDEIDLDLTQALNSIRTKDRADDISAALVNAVRDLAYRMYSESGYQAALDASGFGSKTPRLLVGTDTVIQRHLMVQGDSRTFGIAFSDAQIVTSFDTRMANKIVITLTRESTTGLDPLARGTHAWIPELTSSIPVTRDGATYKETMVQPRTRHINNVPIMGVINVIGLEEVLTSKIA